MTGHPDDQSYASWRGDIIAANSAFSLSLATPFHANAIVTNWQSLTLEVITAQLSGATVTVTYFSDPTFAIITGQLQWQISNTCDLQCIVPVLGNVMALDISTSGVAAGNLSVMCLPANNAVSATRYWQPKNTAHNTAHSIAPLGTFTDDLPHVSEGPGYLYFRDRQNSGKLTMGLFAVNPDNTLGNRLYFDDTPARPFNTTFIGARHPIAIQIANVDAVNTWTFDYWLALDGR
jgi:hypothetical protein